jgi:hypothetical protein
MGWLERGFAAQLRLKLNEDLWDQRWISKSTSSLVDHSLGNVSREIDSDLKSIKAWADHRASTMAEITRGSFILCMLLGFLAITGALMGLIQPELSKVGKILELGSLTIVLFMVWRSHRLAWRAQWLSIRETERCLDQAAWLLLLGRTRTYESPNQVKDLVLDNVGLWSASILRATLRRASFPTAHLSSNYLNAVHRLALDNLITSQSEYLLRESAYNLKADHRLERYSNRCVSVGAISAAAYLLLYALLPEILPPARYLGPVLSQDHARHVFSLTASTLGILMPTAAATCAAIRHYGEYAQVSSRFRNTSLSLQKVSTELQSRLQDRRRGIPSPQSRLIASEISEATDLLLQEVQSWNSILRRKELELT